MDFTRWSMGNVFGINMRKSDTPIRFPTNESNESPIHLSESMNLSSILVTLSFPDISAYIPVTTSAEADTYFSVFSDIALRFPSGNSEARCLIIRCISYIATHVVGNYWKEFRFPIILVWAGALYSPE